MSSTYRTLRDGRRVDSDGATLSDDFNPFPIRVHETTITGTELQSANGTPVEVVPAVSGKRIVPLSWHVVFDHAGGTDFSGNDDLLLLDNGVTTIGEATGAIGGSADLVTLGSLVTVPLTASAALEVGVKTGETTGGHATASAKVRVFYVLI